MKKSNLYCTSNCYREIILNQRYPLQEASSDNQYLAHHKQSESLTNFQILFSTYLIKLPNI